MRLVSLDGTNQVRHAGVRAAHRIGRDRSGAQMLAELFVRRPFMADGTSFLWDPLAAAMAAGYPLFSLKAARVDVEEAEGPEVGFSRPVEGPSNFEYLSSADRAAVEDTLLETLN